MLTKKKFVIIDIMGHNNNYSLIFLTYFDNWIYLKQLKSIDQTDSIVSYL